MPNFRITYFKNNLQDLEIIMTSKLLLAIYITYESSNIQ